MLSQLYIKNIAVISEALIDLRDGLNVFTGETGAGKTVLIGAINAVLGERTSKDMIRTGEDRAVVSALFTDIGCSAASALEKAGYSPEEDGSLLITREIGADSKSSCKIGGRPATVSILKEVASCLIAIHGQRDTQQLLSGDRHMEFIDAYGELYESRGKYRTVYDRLCAVREELDALCLDEAQKARRIDLLRYQIEEIEQAQLISGEEEELKSQRKVVKNSVHIIESLSGALRIFDGGDERDGLSQQFALFSDHLSGAGEYVDTLEESAARVSEIGYELEEFGSQIRDCLESLDCDPAQLDEIERRLDVIYRLKKKYGADIDEILKFLTDAQQELESIETSDQRENVLREQSERLYTEAKTLAAQLTKLRLKAGEAFTARIGDELAFLDMPSVSLSVSRAEAQLGPRGTDRIELMIVTNVGEKPKPLAKIASGGEMSRIMLAIKNVLADKDEIPTLIFDEVDTGVSGRAAHKIGKKLRQVGAHRQVICVTHLAQVAAFGQHHLYIYKITDEQHAYTRIEPLDRERRIQELARISGSEQLTETALKNAEEMLSLAQS